MTNNTYNGWKNWETWIVNLWLSNDQSLDETTNQCQSANEIKELVETLVDEEVQRSGFVRDLVNGSLSEVDWHEIWEARREE